MNNYVWKSSMADHMQEYLVLKRMSGFKYQGEGRMMEMFDQYCYDIGFNGDRLNADLVNGFCYGVYYEKASTRYQKEKLLSGTGGTFMYHWIPILYMPQEVCAQKTSIYPLYFFRRRTRKLVPGSRHLSITSVK